MSESLYFIAIVPPQKIQDQITDYKKEVAEKFGSKHALNAPPHITLHMPFKWKDKKLGKLESVMNEINAAITPFSIDLKDFDFFEPRVVFVDVLENKPLVSLQKKVVSSCRRGLNLDNGNYKDRPFHPHMTIAFRDLKKPKFYDAKRYFEELTFSEQFLLEEVSLLTHDGVKWNVMEFS
ncbi:MAG: 2'-5' RNA ligase family protein [Ekhidna sp.]